MPKSGLAHRDFAIYIPRLASAIAVSKSRRSPLLIRRSRVYVCVLEGNGEMTRLIRTIARNPRPRGS